MAKRSTPIPSARQAPARLTKPREELRAQLQTRLQLADEIAKREIRTEADLTEALASFGRWTDFNHELLRRAFTTEEYATAYRSVTAYLGWGDESPSDKLKSLGKKLEVTGRNLTSLVERLDLIDEEPGLSVAAPAVTQRPAFSENRKVFLVHGQDEEAKSVVARFIEKCGLETIILHEQADQGRTIIEKFEQEADVGFAVILLTPDDVGGLSDPADRATSRFLKPRARQNVVLELGYFIGRLSRSRVCALRKGDTEIPSDISGVVYTPLDPDGAWKMKLAKELKAAGYAVDLNIALG